MKKVFIAMLAAMSLMLASCGDDDEKEDGNDEVVKSGKDDEENKRGNNDEIIDDGGMIIDWSPIILRFHVVNPNHQTNFVSENYNDIIHTTTLTYKGKTYSVAKKISKAYMPFFYGLCIDSSAVDQPFFYFGELDGSYNFDDDFVITFADGSTETIHFKRVHKGGLNVDDTWSLNGEKHNGGSFIIYREKQDDGSLAKPQTTANTPTD